MEIKPYWVLVMGFIILLLFVILVLSMAPRPQWHYMGYRPGHYIPESSNWFGPGGTQRLFSTEGFAEGSSQGFAGSFAEGFAGANDATFSMFAMPWCGHCKTASPIFKSLGSKVTIGGKDVALRHVNCEEEPAAAAGYDIQGYPTFYLDHAGKRTKYEGARNAESFQAFLEQNLSL